MTAPTPVQTDPPTQPISQTLPPAGNWLMSEHSVLLIPGVIVSAVLISELVVRPYLLLTDEARSDFALLAVPLVLIFIVGGGFLFARAISRGKDGRS